MDYLSTHFKLDLDPVASKDAIVVGQDFRFTILTPQLIRLEYARDGRFEDRASQVFWYRRQPVPEFSVRKQTIIEIETEYLHLFYDPTSQGFSPETLKIELKNSGTVWHYGDVDKQNLLGTARTLDGVDGKIELNQGLMSRSGWAVIDDSSTLVFNESNWLETRSGAERGDKLDLYFFGYGRDYPKCLRDFTKLSGKVPLLPRWVLGNWWSRYWAYSDEDLRELMTEFQQRGIPLSVCIIDMDWHVIDNDCHRGWTGYTWNRELFPEPEKFIDWLHNKGLKTALNLHPADGIAPHEDAYESMAEFMRIDPSTKQTIEFNIANPKFIEAYFEILHHPMEEEDGVDFWWMDWQQGTRTKVKGLDPLWALNHLHFLDRGRKKRPFVFSRWSGLGSHRYPIGFSGDTIVSWDSLSFQPYFTSTASNVGFGWWSHDIGGHMLGSEDPELYARWVQFGVFSPIMRLHSTKDSYLDRRPWGHGDDVYRIAKEAMQFRHSLIPYLYTMSWENENGLPLIRPMYFIYPESEEAYCCPDQYFFGSELLVSPYTAPKGADTNLSRQGVWLPKGTWFNFWTGEYRQGDKWYAEYGKLDEVPVFAKAGAIVPLGPRVEWGGIHNPTALELYIFPGNSNVFKLYEDDGDSLEYRGGKYALTEFAQDWEDNRLRFSIEPVTNDVSCVPSQRDYSIHFRGIRNPENIDVIRNGETIDAKISYEENKDTLVVSVKDIRPSDHIVVELETSEQTLISMRDRMPETIKRMITEFRVRSWVKSRIECRIKECDEAIDLLRQYAPLFKDEQLRALIEVLFGVGFERIIDKGSEKAVLWNNSNNPEAAYLFSAWNRSKDYFENGSMPKFTCIDLNQHSQQAWRLNLRYFDLYNCTLESQLGK